MGLFFRAAILTSLLLGHVTRWVVAADPDPNDEEAAKRFLQEFNDQVTPISIQVAKASWTSKTNITDYNDHILIEVLAKEAVFNKEMRQRALAFNASAMSSDVKRQLDKIKDIGTSALSDTKKLDELHATTQKMSGIYSTAEVCLQEDREKNCHPLEPDLTDMLANGRDYHELEAIWVGWRNVTGPKMRETFTKYAQLSNEAVKELGFSDAGEYWRSAYETDTFEEDIQALLRQVKPLYEQLHAYVRKRLREKYGADKFPVSGHIPAHLLGNMWAQQWQNIYDLVIPYKEKHFVNITKTLLDQNYTVTRMFRTAEDFFVSIGFEPMVPTFWNRSMLVKPTDGRKVVCHASAADFTDGKDFRIKMCTSITEKDLMTIHHEMGHVQYYMHYKDQPMVYRSGANHGFHEAVGDTIALSVSTPEHMEKIRLLESAPQDDNEAEISFLMKKALEKVAVIPFAYVLDLWRWSVFKGDTPPDTYNRDWWDLRCAYQGLSPPVPRSEEDFDPGAKYHVTSGTRYIRYFVSHIIQFQFHKAACDAAGHTGPYHKCDIYGSREAGKLIGDMLSMGASKPWPEAMKKITGQEKMDAQPLLDYFQPLLEFLRKENGNDYGWIPTCPKGSFVGSHSQNDDKGIPYQADGTGTPAQSDDNGKGGQPVARVSVLTVVITYFLTLAF